MTVASSAVSPDGLVARAAALRPRLRALQTEHEAAGGYGREIHEAFREARLYRVLHPRRFGGLEQDLETFVRVGIEIARGDPAVGWAWILCGAHTFHAASFLGEQGQAELLGGDDGAGVDLIAPSRVAPTGRAVPVPGGYRVSGTWSYCSGSTWSTHVVVAARTEDDQIFVVVPRADYAVLDDWGGDATLGMGASGSNSVRVADAFVPEHLTFPATLMMDGPADLADSPGYALHGNPLYLGRSAMFFAAELVTSVVGAAWAAADEYAELMATRSTPFPPVTRWLDSDDHHRRYGTILARAEAAEELLRGAARRHGELCRRWVDAGEPFTAGRDLRLRAVVQQAGALAAEAVDLALTGAGTSSTRRGSRLARYHGDATMYRTHVLADPEATAVAASRDALERAGDLGPPDDRASR